MKLNIKYFILMLLVALVPLSGNNSPLQLPYKLILILFSLIGYAYVLKAVFSSHFITKFFSSLIVFLCLSTIIGAIVNSELYTVDALFDLIGFLVVLPFPLLVAYCLRCESRKRKIYLVLLFLVIMNFIFGIVQLVLGKDILFGNPPISGRISGLFSWGAPVVGSFAGLVFPLLVYFYLNQKLKFTLGLLFFAIVILLGGNRSMFLVDFITLILLLLCFSKHRGYAISFFLITATVIVVTLPLILLYLPEYFSANLLYRITSLGGDIIQEQQTKRIATWIQTSCMIADHPLLGVGMGNYKLAILDYLSCAVNSEGQMPHPHHVYLDIISTQGFLGFVILGVFVISIAIATKFQIKDSAVKIENYLILLIIFSPLNVTHGFASAWWSFLCFVMLGIAIANIRLASIHHRF